MNHAPFTALCCAASLLCAAETNLLINPEFRGYDDRMEGWNQNPIVSNGCVKRLEGQGPEKRTALRVDFSRYGSLKQAGIKLAAGEKYRIGGWVRTKNFKSPFRVCSFLVSNFGWTSAVSTPRFPVNTDGKWVKLERVVTMPKSSDGTYTFHVYGDQGSGVFEFCHPFLIPLSEKGRAESRPMPDWREKLKRVTPFYPLLSKVSAATGEIGFCVVGPAGTDFADYRCRVSYAPGKSGKFGKAADFPFDRHGTCKTFLGKIPEGEGRVRAELIRKSDGALLRADEYPLTAVEPLTVRGKWLNNFVFELLRTPLKEGSVSFTAPDGGWYRIALSRPLRGVTIALDGAPVVKYRENEPSETMRRLRRGKHTLTVSGTGISGGEVLIVSKVPATPCHPLFPNLGTAATPGEKSFRGAFRYDIGFCRRFLWPNINTIVSQGPFPLATKEDHALKAELKERGMEILGCNGVSKAAWRDAEKIARNIQNTLHVKNGDGRTLDEAFPNSPVDVQLALIELGWKLQNYDKIVHLWQGVYMDKYFDDHDLHRPLIGSMSNISRGKGKLLLETYARVTPTEKLMTEQLKRYPRQLEEVSYIPGAPERFIFFLGGYCKPGHYCTDSYPESDPKYFWDKFFHLLATHPACRGVAGMGGYSMGNSDEEMLRYFAALIRHYCLEGNTTLFSEKFGYKLNPGHLKDGDFREGLKHWNARPAGKETLKGLTIPGYGKKYQCRQGRDIPGVGDTCALFTAEPGKANVLSQKITGLRPGKLYSLSFVTADPDDIARPKMKHQDFVFNAALKGVRVLPEYGWELRSPEKWDRRNIARKSREIHIRKIVFQAETNEAELILSDAGAPAGQKRIVNFVTVRPYFAPKNND